jgi:hypothetical protein
MIILGYSVVNKAVVINLSKKKRPINFLTLLQESQKTHK